MKSAKKLKIKKCVAIEKDYNGKLMRDRKWSVKSSIEKDLTSIEQSLLTVQKGGTFHAKVKS